MQKILVPVDGSEPANRALAFAVERARANAAEMTLVFVINRLEVARATADPNVNVDPAPMLEEMESNADAILEAAASVVRKAGIPVTADKLDGSAGTQIVAYAAKVPTDLIVMGSHGRRGFAALALGSTAVDVIRAAAVPVFVVTRGSATATDAGPLRRALVAIDGSPAASAALNVACGIARTERTSLTLCTVSEYPGAEWAPLDANAVLRGEVATKAAGFLETDRARAAALGIQVDTVERTGNPADEIVAAAALAGADCIVMGTHGRGGIPRFLLGSVAEAVLQKSPIPVCTIRT